MTTDDSMQDLAPLTICDMRGVSGGDEGFPVQLILDRKTNKFFVRGINEGGFACVDIDLAHVLAWLAELCPEAIQYDALISSLSAKFNRV